MDLATLEITKDEAQARLAEYREAIKHERNAEDEAIAAAYRAAARGLPIISLRTAIAAGGLFANGLPRIAIARADAKQCTVVRWTGHDAGFTFSDERARSRWNRGPLTGLHSVRVDVDMMPPDGRTAGAGTTVVPPVPPRHRPKRGRLGRFHILWEVEKWDRTAPHDPALLRHIRGDLWAIMATWDLTEVERHVLAQRS